jgi:hypothetical protein
LTVTAIEDSDIRTRELETRLILKLL